MVQIELVYVARDRTAFQVKMDLKKGSTVAEALNESGIYLLHPETKDMSVGIYAKRVSLDTLLQDGDRIEIYRSLTLDPKEKRRQRARLNNKRV
jgi:putative ubiquitin-RnfH superfamily antitoxin RatB of RatAB toxin-antitoxin module